MKFEEKLIALRKQKLLSQEQLAEKLNVTRQTVSKWELGQSKPDMDKLTAMSKLFNVNIDTLTNSETLIADTKQESNDKNTKEKIKGDRKFILYILIAIFIISLCTLLIRIGNDIKVKKEAKEKEILEKRKEAEKIQQQISDKIKRQQEETKKEEEKNSFNDDFEFWSGTQTKTPVSKIIDNAISNNKRSTEHLIEFVFDGSSYGTNPESIKTIKNNLKDFKGYSIQYYEVTFDYDSNGYINKVTIETR